MKVNVEKPSKKNGHPGGRNKNANSLRNIYGSIW
jgi:hypothetical protein